MHHVNRIIIEHRRHEKVDRRHGINVPSWTSIIPKFPKAVFQLSWTQRPSWNNHACRNEPAVMGKHAAAEVLSKGPFNSHAVVEQAFVKEHTVVMEQSTRR